MQFLVIFRKRFQEEVSKYEFELFRKVLK